MAEELYNVAGTLQGILARRKAEEQQALENARRDKALESEMAYRAENMKSMAQQREIMNEQRILQMLDSGVYGRGEAVGQLDPEVLAVGKKYGRIAAGPGEVTEKETTQMLPNSQGETEETLDETPVTEVTVGPDRDIYRGTPAELAADRERQRKQQVWEGIIQSGVLTDPNMSPVERLGILQKHTGDFDAKAIATMLENESERQNMLVYDQQTNKFTPAIDPTTGKPIRGRGADPIINRSRPAASIQAPPNHREFMGQDAQGRPVLFGYNPRTNAMEPMTVPAGATVTGRAPTVNNQTGQRPPVITPQQAQQLAKLKSAAFNRETGERRGWTARQSDEYFNLVDNILSTARVSDRTVIDSVREVLEMDETDDASAARSNAEIIAMVSGAEGVTPESLADFKALLEAVRD